ncbi:MAG: FkbM family methyltransferase [Bacillota bacterium]
MLKINFDEILNLPVQNLTLEKLPKLERRLVLYGTGALGKTVLLHLKNLGISPIAICDSNPAKIGMDFYNYKIMDFKDVLLRFSDFDVLIAIQLYYPDVKKYLLNYISIDRIHVCMEISGLRSAFLRGYNAFISNKNNQSRLNVIYEKLHDDRSRQTMLNVIKGNYTYDLEYFQQVFTPNQYFNEITCSEENEYYIDAGAYNGDTLLQYTKFVDGKYKKIWAFEPFEDSFIQLERAKKELYHNDDCIHLYKSGLYHYSGKIGFNNQVSVSSMRIDDSYEANSIDVVSIDDLIASEVSFIKMDIEGSELNALKGAEKTILKYKPKLAICVYHKIDDMLTIPEYIMSLNLPYKYYFRHHDITENETVFYAV